jgi:hypothetical protein
MIVTISVFDRYINVHYSNKNAEHLRIFTRRYRAALRLTRWMDLHYHNADMSVRFYGAKNG